MPASKERQAEIQTWIEQNQKLLSKVDWDKPAVLKSTLLSYDQMLIYQALCKDRLYSDNTEPFDALRSFRRYVLKHVERTVKV